MSNDFSNHWDLILLVHTVAFPPPPPPPPAPFFLFAHTKRKNIIFAARTNTRFMVSHLAVTPV